MGNGYLWIGVSLLRSFYTRGSFFTLLFHTLSQQYSIHLHNETSSEASKVQAHLMENKVISTEVPTQEVGNKRNGARERFILRIKSHLDYQPKVGLIRGRTMPASSIVLHSSNGGFVRTYHYPERRAFRFKAFCYREYKIFSLHKLLPIAHEIFYNEFYGWFCLSAIF